MKNVLFSLKKRDEIDFKKFDKKFTELGLTKGRGWFLKFLGLR
jgi:hypothetical protein